MKEHDMVIFVKEHKGKPIGTIGCIVHEYQGGAFEVETEIDGGTICSSVEPGYLMQHPLCSTKEVWEAQEQLVAGLKSGDITVEQLRELRKKETEKRMNALIENQIYDSVSKLTKDDSWI